MAVSDKTLMAEIPMNRLAEVLGTQVEETVRSVKIELFNGVIRDTRVDKGRMRGNWQTTTGSPASSATLRKDHIAQGSDGGAAQAEASAGVKADTVDYLTNNVTYAAVWEERDGMVARNVARLERIVKELTRGR